jgi:alkaline phosphatase D
MAVPGRAKLVGMSSALGRRDFLRSVVVVAGPTILVGCADGDVPPKRPPSPKFFPQSVASGDPRPASVVLWTRVEDADAAGALEVELDVALDEEFSELVELTPGSPTLSLTTDENADHCVKVRLENLEASTSYYYRFTYVRGDERFVSRTGRTRTAPDPDADVSPRFAVVSCQDYSGKYFHVLRHVMEQSLDFFVHLGDYVYETIDDPTFQDPTRERRVRFRNPEEARPRGTGGERLAASSFGNYCDLYRTVRADLDLQRLHENVPMIAVWDDHEFSNDSHGATGTYTNGLTNEEDLERRRNADRAWFSYMPVDYAEAPAAALDESAAFPDDLRIYRDFVFGRHLELLMTDLRRYRPDHLVPENAFPGAVYLEQDQAIEILGDDPEGALPYVNVDEFAGGVYGDALRAAAAALGFEPERIGGPMSVRWLNGMLGQAGVTDPAPIDEADTTLLRGFAYAQLFKNEEYGSFGARQLVAEVPFLALAAKRWRETGGSDQTSGTSEVLFGAEQRAWFTETLLASTRTWKIWGNEYTLMPRVLDLRAVTLAPEELRARVLITVDDWDGAPNERAALLRELSGVQNLVVVTGDLHAFFAGTPYPPDDPSARVIEFVAGSVSSTPWLPTIERVIENEPSIPPEAAALALAVEGLLKDDQARPNPHMGWLDLRSNGYALLTARAEFLEATVFTLHESYLSEKEPSGDFDGHFSAVEFRVQAGSRDLEQQIAGAWRRWDIEEVRWV